MFKKRKWITREYMWYLQQIEVIAKGIIEPFNYIEIGIGREQHLTE